MNREAKEEIPAEILVVDDIPANLKLLADILTERGYRVRPAADGHLALRSVAIRRPCASSRRTSPWSWPAATTRLMSWQATIPNGPRHS